MQDTAALLKRRDFPSIHRGQLKTLQANLGYRCNLSCTHCHVNAGPKRTELMSRQTIDQLLNLVEQQQIEVLDLTGGAPELNPHFRYLVEAAAAIGVNIIDRCNLVILLEPGFEDLAEFLAENRVEIVASLPCYLPDNVSQQRGKGVYEKSIEALKQLNSLGYGRQPELPLNLVYNPTGPVLPPPQQALQAQYRQQLKQQFGIDFNQLFTLTNVPIKRFGSVLVSQGQFDDYLSLLKQNFSAANLATVMCRELISVDWQGVVYDCDFNQMLGWPLIASDKRRLHIADLLVQDLVGMPIVVGEHCYACTAGQGSSCGGALNG